MKIIGVTGSFGTGKTYVSSVFGLLGAKVIDADRVGRSVLKTGSVVHREVVSAFGRKILAPDGSISRKKLAGVVFSDKKSLTRLNGMTHPGIIKRIREIVLRSGRKGIIVIDAPLLFEAKFENFVDYIVVVRASLKKQVERCGKKFCLKRGEVLGRIRSQMPLRTKARYADFIVDNDGTKAGTRKQVIKIWRKVWR